MVKHTNILLCLVAATVIATLIYYYVFIHEEISGGLLAPSTHDHEHDHLGRKLQKQDGFKFDLRSEGQITTEAAKGAARHRNSKVNENSEEDNGELDDLEIMKAKARVSKYCNHVDQEIKGEEGESPDGFTLEHVHVLIRHGDRSPMYTLPGHGVPSLECRINLTAWPGDPLISTYVQSMQDLWPRLEPRSPALRYGLYPHSQHCEGAQLTGLGAIQQLRNGHLLNQAYIKRLQLLSEDSPASQIYVRTTEYSRTYQSAVAFFHAFLPRFNHTYMRFHFSKYTNFCSQRFSGMTCDCMMAYRLQAITQKEYNRRTKNSSLHRQIKQELSQFLEISSGKLPWVSAISDVLMGYACHKMALPCSKTAPHLCIGWDLIGRIWQFLDANGLAQLGSYANTKMHRLMMHPLLHEILHRMKNVTRGIEKSKFVLYSGHDKTVTPMAVALGIHNGYWPQYASRIALELYSNRLDGYTNYSVKFLYNGQDMTSKVRFCRNKPLPHGLCPLEYFDNFVTYEDLKEYGRVNYNDACSVS